MRNGHSRQILVAGGAGFLGSHLCERLVGEGHDVTCLDNLQTGSRDNLRRLSGSDRFELVVADIVDPLPARVVKRRFERIYNLACAASPPLYQADPEHTLLTSVLGAFVILVAAPAGPATLAFGVVSGLLIAVAPWIRGGPRILGPLLLLLGTIPFAAYTWWSIVTPLIAVLALIAGFVALRR